MSSLIQQLIFFSVSTEHLKIKLAHHKIINDKLSTVELKTINFFRTDESGIILLKIYGASFYKTRTSIHKPNYTWSPLAL